MSMTIQSSVKDKILATSSETSKGMMRTVVMDEAHASRLPVLWAEVGESSLIGPELVQEMTDKVVLIKEKFKAARDRQKSYADNSRKSLEFKVGNHELLKVMPWKGIVHLGKKGKLVPRSRLTKTLRFIEEPVENSDREVKRLKCSRMVVVKFLFVELRDRVVNDVVMQLKVFTSLLNDGRGKIIDSKILVKVRWNSKRGPEFTWEREDYMKSKYPQLFVGRADESTSMVYVIICVYVEIGNQSIEYDHLNEIGMVENLVDSFRSLLVTRK
ncbi:hypothetical protein Tco_0432037 [Tanacetum coccineum]